MKRFWIWMLLFSVVGIAKAQTTTVSATAQDSDGTIWAGGSVAVQFIPNPSSPGIGNYNINGVSLNPAIVTQPATPLSGGGNFTVTVYDNSLVTPGGSQWQFTVCPNASGACGVYTTAVSGTLIDISAGINSVIKAPRFQPVANTYGYVDIEAALQLKNGSTYYDVTAKCQKLFNGTTWACGSGGGGSAPAPPSYAVQLANNDATALAADPSILINPIAHSLTSPILNGSRYAASYQTGGGDNGIANAAATNQTVVADPSYAITEQYSFDNMIPNVPPAFHYEDLRQGIKTDFFHTWNEPTGLVYNFGLRGAAQTTNCLYDGTPAFSGDFMQHHCHDYRYETTEPGVSFGNEYSPGFNAPLWRVAHISNYYMRSRGSGITQTLISQLQNYGVGDTMATYFYTSGENGTTAASDEGMKGFGNNVLEDQYVFTGTCATGCTTGSPLIHANVTLPAQGTGRYLIDLARGTSTTVTAPLAVGLQGATAVTVASTVPVSSAVGSLATAPCGPYLGSMNFSPPFSRSYTCDITVTSGTFNTTDLLCFGAQFHECTVPTAVTSLSGGHQSVTMPLRKPHGAGATANLVMQGGMAGYGLEFTAFNQSRGVTLRYLLDIIGSTDANTIQVMAFEKGVAKSALSGVVNSVNVMGNFTLASLTNSGTTVSGISGPGLTPGTAISAPSSYNYGSFKISGASDAAFNNVCTNFQWSSSTQFTCTMTGLSGSHTAASATATLNNNAIVMWPMAEVIDVQNETTTPPAVDGTLALEPNIVPFVSGDALEEPHHLSSELQAQTNIAYSWNPWNKDSGALSITTLGAGYNSANNNALLLITNAADDNFFARMGGVLPAPIISHVRGSYSTLQYTDYAPSNGSVLGVGISAKQKLDQTLAYNLFSLAGSAAFTGCGASYVPYTNILTYSGCAKTIFSGGPGSVVLPSVTIKTPAGFNSGISYNYTPYSNAIDTVGSSGVWAVTGGAGTVTCSITDDLGNPACTMVNSSSTDNFNWDAYYTTGYTALPPSTVFTTQVRAKGLAGTEIITLGAAFTGGGAYLTTTWNDYCVTYTTPAAGSTYLTNLGLINVSPNSTVYVSNIVTRPGPDCGPPLPTTGAGGTLGSQYTTPTTVNSAGSLAVNELKLPTISSQCLETDATGIVTGSGSSCGTGAGGVSDINGTPGAFTFNFSAGAGSCTGTTCTFTGSGTGGGSVTDFIAGTWPSWLTPMVILSTTTPTLAVTAGPIPNSALQNPSTTVNGQTCTLGSTCSISVGTGTTITVCSGTKALSTGAIAAGARAHNTVTCTGAAVGDNVLVDWNGADPDGITGYDVTVGYTLTLYKKVSATNTVDIEQANSVNNPASITPGAVTVNFRVVR